MNTSEKYFSSLIDRQSSALGVVKDGEKHDLYVAMRLLSQEIKAMHADVKKLLEIQQSRR